jgi:hypothetical protein
MVTLSARVLGRSKSVIPDWEIPFPPDFHEEGERLTLRDLITRIVREEVAAFRQRQEERKFIRMLTAEQIAAGVEKGKVDMGGRDLEQEVVEDEAVATALQAFEDGLFLVIVDDKEERELDGEVFLKPDSQLTFLRLVALAGG